MRPWTSGRATRIKKWKTLDRHGELKRGPGRKTRYVSILYTRPLVTQSCATIPRQANARSTSHPQLEQDCIPVNATPSGARLSRSRSTLRTCVQAKPPLRTKVQVSAIRPSLNYIVYRRTEAYRRTSRCWLANRRVGPMRDAAKH